MQSTYPLPVSVTRWQCAAIILDHASVFVPEVLRESHDLGYPAFYIEGVFGYCILLLKSRHLQRRFLPISLRVVHYLSLFILIHASQFLS